MTLIFIFLAGGLGSVCRYLLGALVQSRTHLNFPAGTLLVNVLGCLLIGVFAKAFLHSQTHLMARATLIVGFCGGFTTFSTFSYETLGLLNGGEWLRALAYAAISVLACVAGTAAGFVLTPSLLR